MKNTTKVIIAGTCFAIGAAFCAAAPASENWANNCTKCHGADGKGETKIGKKLHLKDYTSAAVQAKLTDEEIVTAITAGVKDASGKEKMKGFKAELSAQEIKDLVAHVRAFKS